MSKNSSNIAIKVENLGKKYVINHKKGNGDDNFREVIIGNTKKILTSLNPFSQSSKKDTQKTTEDFWALDDVNFEINKGDKVGIIGRNGAGKSTLLKVLSRITEPTTGKIHINGRIASLLEVGTGFHPELTGRENIYLNGAILGMSRKEIKEKFDEIVAFAEVDKFLDTPVKRYSSGMYVRLAFSVAAHLEPEILVVDEVLAVGDAAFQKKCLGKMNDVSKDGRTIIFVSHNMNAMEQLCNNGIWLEDGQIAHIGNMKSCISQYVNLTLNNNVSIWHSSEDTKENRIFKPLSMTISDHAGANSVDSVSRNDVAFIQLKFEIYEMDPSLTIGVALYDEFGQYLFHTLQTDSSEDKWPQLNYGINKIQAKLPLNLFQEGKYKIVMLAALHKREWIIKPDDSEVAITLNVNGGISKSPLWTSKRRGVIAPIISWHTTSD